MTNPAIQTLAEASRLEAEASDLDTRAARKERQAEADWVTNASADALRTDARYFREEAKAKRAKAERLRKASAK